MSMGRMLWLRDREPHDFPLLLARFFLDYAPVCSGVGNSERSASCRQAPRAAARGQPWRGQPWRRAGRRSCSWSASRTRGQRGRAERARVGLPPAVACHEGNAREPPAQTCRPCRAAADTSSGQTVMRPRRVPATTAVSVSSRERSWSDSKRRRLLAVSTAGRAPSGRAPSGGARAEQRGQLLSRRRSRSKRAVAATLAGSCPALRTGRACAGPR